ncbi:50S ribosomal protein L15 [Candidatus Wolfebacteria bacterium]|nr:50S ribosomal protein L15 [Candidatus Wolfebacteria bacterium]
MQLHQLKSKYKNKSKKRIGRGGKRGTYSGRGLKGQKSRSGHRVRPAERDMIQRIPKLRGFKFKAKAKPVIVNIGDLAKCFNGDRVNLEELTKAHIVKEGVKRVKILGEGEIKRALEISGLPISSGAKKKIESAGGRVT